MNDKDRAYFNILFDYVVKSLISFKYLKIIKSDNEINITGSILYACIRITSNFEISCVSQSGVEIYSISQVTKCPLDDSGFDIWKDFCVSFVLAKTEPLSDIKNNFYWLIVLVNDVKIKLKETNSGVVADTLLFALKHDGSKYTVCTALSLCNRDTVIGYEYLFSVEDNNIILASNVKNASISLKDLSNDKERFINDCVNIIVSENKDNYGSYDLQYDFSIFANNITGVIKKNLDKDIWLRNQSSLPVFNIPNISTSIIEDTDSSKRLTVNMDSKNYFVSLADVLKVEDSENKKSYIFDDNLFLLPTSDVSYRVGLRIVADAICYWYLHERGITGIVNMFSDYDLVKKITKGIDGTLRIDCRTMGLEYSSLEYYHNYHSVVFDTKYKRFNFLIVEGNISCFRDNTIDKSIDVKFHSNEMQDFLSLESPKIQDFIKSIQGYVLKGNNNLPLIANKKSEIKSEDLYKGLRIVALKYNNKLIGFRFKGDNLKGYDISIEAAERHNISALKVATSINLENNNGLLISKSEKNSGSIIKDISNNSKLIEELLKKLCI